MAVIRSHQRSFSLLPQETLLEGLERTGHDIEYQCRNGYCGACRVRALGGEVEYVEQPLAFIAADEILPCCSTPKSDLWLDCNLSLAFENPQMQSDMFPVQQPLFDDNIPSSEQSLLKKFSRRKVNKVTPPTNLTLF